MLIAPTCVVCGTGAGLVCPSCEPALVRAPSLATPYGLDTCRALLAYDDAARALVTALKNRQRRDLVGPLADALVARTAPPPPAAVVAWAPTGRDRRQARGFDQAQLLAVALARRWGIPMGPRLRRLAGPAQAGRTGAARRRHPGFVALGSVRGPVVVVDDVATTGATLAAAARALRQAGATEVHGVVVARADVPGRA